MKHQLIPILNPDNNLEHQEFNSLLRYEIELFYLENLYVR